jgi:hypothetical protein
MYDRNILGFEVLTGGYEEFYLAGKPTYVSEEYIASDFRVVE